MEQLSLQSIEVAVICAVTVTWVWRTLEWLWLRPKKLERCLREQGLMGSPYRLFHGDMKETSEQMKQVLSTPITVSDDFLPRVIFPVYQSFKNYGRSSFVWVGPIPKMIITEPKQVKDILTNLEDFHKKITIPIVRLLVTGFASYNGQKWVKHRKIINPAFRLKLLKNMMPVFHLSCCEMINNWGKMISEEGYCEINVWPHLESLTSDVISRTAFGSSFQEGRRIFQLLKEQAALATKVMQSVYIPGSRFLPTKLNKRMKDIDREIQSLLKEMISKREQAMESGESVNSDLLGILIESNSKEVRDHGGNKNVGMSTGDVIEECKLFFFAGSETTSSLLAWTMVMLGKHQQWQKQAREEVREIFGDSIPDFDGLSRLKVVTMILYEVLRLYPPVAALFRIVKRNTKLGGLSLPAGVQLTVPTILIQQDPELWGDDAKEFNPERFSNGVSKAMNGQVSYFPFGWGPRLCIGQNFAMLEAKMALVLILQNFEFELSPSYVHAPIMLITLQPQYGVNVVLRNAKN